MSVNMCVSNGLRISRAARLSPTTLLCLIYDRPCESAGRMAKHLIHITGVGFVCSCGEQYDASNRSLIRRKNRPRAVAAQHQLAAFVQSSMNGGEALVTNCLSCNGEAIIPAAAENTVDVFSNWLRTQCAFCGKTPNELADTKKP